MRCRRPYCNGTVLDGACLLCCRAPEGTTPEPLQMPVPLQRLSPEQRQSAYGLLAYLSKRPGLTTAEIARGMGVSRPSMQGRLDALLKRHEVVRAGKGGVGGPHRWSVEEIEEASA